MPLSKNYKKYEPYRNILQTKINWIEIKALEREYKRNQSQIKEIEKANKDLITQLGEKLDKLQELAEERDNKNSLFDHIPGDKIIKKL